MPEFLYSFGMVKRKRNTSRKLSRMEQKALENIRTFLAVNDGTAPKANDLAEQMGVSVQTAYGYLWRLKVAGRLVERKIAEVK